MHLALKEKEVLDEIQIEMFLHVMVLTSVTLKRFFVLLSLRDGTSMSNIFAGAEAFVSSGTQQKIVCCAGDQQNSAMFGTLRVFPSRRVIDGSS